MRRAVKPHVVPGSNESPDTRVVGNIVNRKKSSDNQFDRLIDIISGIRDSKQRSKELDRFISNFITQLEEEHQCNAEDFKSKGLLEEVTEFITLLTNKLMESDVRHTKDLIKTVLGHSQERLWEEKLGAVLNVLIKNENISYGYIIEPLVESDKGCFLFGEKIREFGSREEEKEEWSSHLRFEYVVLMGRILHPKWDERKMSEKEIPFLTLSTMREAIDFWREHFRYSDARAVDFAVSIAEVACRKRKMTDREVYELTSGIARVCIEKGFSEEDVLLGVHMAGGSLYAAIEGIAAAKGNVKKAGDVLANIADLDSETRSGIQKYVTIIGTCG